MDGDHHVAELWKFGRDVDNLQFEKWEGLFAEPLAEVRPRFGVPPDGVRARAS